MAWVSALMGLVASALGVGVDANHPMANSFSVGVQHAASEEPQPDPQPVADAVADGRGWSFSPALCSTTHDIDIPKRPRWIKHRVVSRETLDEIAFRHGVAPWELRGWNGIGRGVKRVKRGRRLRIKAARIPPPKEVQHYTVRAEDTWSSIATRHGIHASDLRAYNWPYRGKMQAGVELKLYIDPILRDWIDGATAADAVARGGVGIGAPDQGRLLNGVRIPEGEGYWLRLPQSAYGTTHAVGELLAAMTDFRDHATWDGTLAIGSMSSVRGGPLGHHKSHQTGRDVDIRLPRRAGVSRYAELKVRRVDWAATWQFVQALTRADVQVVFFDYRRQKYLHRAAVAAGATKAELAATLQYPRGSHARRGLVRHSPGHEKHVHVRFGCGPCEVSCVASLPEPADAESSP